MQRIVVRMHRTGWVKRSSKNRFRWWPLIVRARLLPLSAPIFSTACWSKTTSRSRRSGPSIAVEFEGTSLTYAELDQRANQLANLLRKHGVECDVLVGVSMERSLEMVVAMLGILKAGGAYVPLDPSFGSGRIHFVLDEARVHRFLRRARTRFVWIPSGAH
jgi:non-ribosomal peptide synthetase component F